jgi:hypothetical protein
MSPPMRLLALASALAAAAASSSSCAALSINVSAPINVIPPHFATWNVDASRDRLFFDVDWASPQLRYLAGAMSANHSHIRFGGTGNDALYYGVGGAPSCPKTVPFSLECLNATLLDGLLALAAAADAQLIFGLNIHPAGGPSPPQGPWDPSNARFLLGAAKAAGSAIGYVELGNEQNTIMSAKQQAAALRVLSALLVELWPAAGRPRLVGPDTHSIHDAGSPNSQVLAYLADFAAAAADLPLHAVTHHEYIEVTWQNALSATFLDQTAELAAQVVAAVRAASPTVEIWAGEISLHNGGGGAGKNATPTNCQDNRACGRFASLVWYADAMASKAAAGYQVFCRQDAVGADYALINASADAVTGAWSVAPTPDFWLLTLWHAIVSGAPGSRANVLGVARGGALPASTRAYAFCPAGVPGGAASVTLLLLNLDSAPACVAAPAFASPGAALTQWSLTPGAGAEGDSPVESREALLNGQLLQLDAQGRVPQLAGRSVDASGGIQLPPMSVSFVRVPTAPGAVAACV